LGKFCPKSGRTIAFLKAGRPDLATVSALPVPVATDHRSDGLGDSRFRELSERIAMTTGLAPTVVDRVIAEVVSALSEPLEALVRRRHRELQRIGLRNDAIYERVVGELTVRPVRSPALTVRQVRRIVYG
jgi:hypothetical protein